MAGDLQMQIHGCVLSLERSDNGCIQSQPEMNHECLSVETASEEDDIFMK